MIKTRQHFWIVLKINFYTGMSGGFYVFVTANIEISASNFAHFGALNVITALHFGIKEIT